MAFVAKDDPGSSDVHVDTAGGSGGPQKKPKVPLPDAVAAIGGLGKSEPDTLYIRRDVTNAKDLIAWAKTQGFKTTLDAGAMHVTICYSKTPVDWMQAGECWCSDPDGGLKIRPGGPRKVSIFGEPLKQCAVLQFASNDLYWRNQMLIDIGATSDYPTYEPHITISYDIDGIDISTVDAYQGEINLGPEIFEAINPDWRSTLVEKFDSFFKVSGVDQGLGLVFGWGIICKENGQDYYDVQKNHIPEAAMVEATTEFMKSSRVHGDMHVRGTTPQLTAGMVVHSFPLTADIAKAMGISSDRTGWMVATAPDAAMLAKFASGEYTGFSIGGTHIEIDGKPVEN